MTEKEDLDCIEESSVLFAPVEVSKDIQARPSSLSASLLLYNKNNPSENCGNASASASRGYFFFSSSNAQASPVALRASGLLSDEDLTALDKIEQASGEECLKHLHMSMSAVSSTVPHGLLINRKNNSFRRLGTDSDEEFVPPHIMSLRSFRENTDNLYSFNPGSLYEGVGRKLRGKDATRFRNNIMRQTGFLENSDKFVC